jgi:hypothetical protein
VRQRAKGKGKAKAGKGKGKGIGKVKGKRKKAEAKAKGKVKVKEAEGMGEEEVPGLHDILVINKTRNQSGIVNRVGLLSTCQEKHITPKNFKKTPNSHSVHKKTRLEKISHKKPVSKNFRKKNGVPQC